MLQVVSGRFFDIANAYETWHRGALFTNYRMWARDGLKTSVGTVYSAVRTNGPLMLTYELLERQPKGDGQCTGVLIATGGAELVNDLSAVMSFVLNVTCTPDPDLARRLVIDERPTLGSDALPRSLVPRIFDKEVHAKSVDAEEVNTFLDKIISLKRSEFEPIMRSVRQYVVATHRLSDNPDLAYAVFVAALESLAQESDGYLPTWDDLENTKRDRFDTALENVDQEAAARVRSAILDIEHTKLKSRFLEFTLRYIRPSFFRDEVNLEYRCIPRSSLNKALARAYDVRSLYIHRLKPVPKQLTMGNIESEWTDDGDGPLLNFAGLSRLVRHVILNFVAERLPGSDPGFNLHDALPNVVTLRIASQYWIADANGYTTASSKIRLAAHFQQLAMAILRFPDAQLTDLRPVMRKIEQVLPGLKKATDRVPMLALYFSFNLVAQEEFRSDQWAAWSKKLEPELNRPTIPTLFLSVFFASKVSWALVESAALAERYFATKFHRQEMDVGDLVEAILLLWLAEQYREIGNDEAARQYLARAVENAPSNLVLRAFEKAQEGAELSEMNWRVLLAHRADAGAPPETPEA